MASTMRHVSLRPDDGRRETEVDVLRSLVDGLIAEDLFGFRSRGRIGSVAGALYLPLTGDERHVQVGLGPDAVVFRARPAAALQPYRLSRPPVLLLGPEGVGPVPLSPRDLLDLLAARLTDPPPPNLDEVLDGLELAVVHGASLLRAEARRGRRAGPRRVAGPPVAARPCAARAIRGRVAPRRLRAGGQGPRGVPADVLDPDAGAGGGGGGVGDRGAR